VSNYCQTTLNSHLYQVKSGQLGVKSLSFTLDSDFSHVNSRPLGVKSLSNHVKQSLVSRQIRSIGCQITVKSRQTRSIVYQITVNHAWQRLQSRQLTSFGCQITVKSRLTVTWITSNHVTCAHSYHAKISQIGSCYRTKRSRSQKINSSTKMTLRPWTRSVVRLQRNTVQSLWNNRSILLNETFE
jgi:hypothetical protein